MKARSATAFSICCRVSRNNHEALVRTLSHVCLRRYHDPVREKSLELIPGVTPCVGSILQYGTTDFVGMPQFFFRQNSLWCTLFFLKDSALNYLELSRYGMSPFSCFGRDHIARAITVYFLLPGSCVAFDRRILNES